MNKTHLLAALALTTATMTGCAVDATPCADDDCIEASAQGFAPDPDRALTPTDDDRNAATEAAPARIVALQEWTLRLADGEADTCDRRFLRYFAAAQRGIELAGCENSVITKFVDHVDEMVIVTPLDEREARWMTLALDIDANAPLTRAQEQMMVQADEAAFRRNDDLKPSIDGHMPLHRELPLDAHLTDRENQDQDYPLDAHVSNVDRTVHRAD